MRFNKPVIAACAILTRDPKLDLATKQSLACVAQQVSNVCRPGNFYDTRAKLISAAHEASIKGDQSKFDENCEWLATITRSAGNPASPGRKTHELLPYFQDSFNKTAVVMTHLNHPKLEMGMAQQMAKGILKVAQKLR